MMKNGGGIVLISFTMGNMLSFRDETTLDMRATSIKAHSYSLIEKGTHKLLPVAAIYGANASGKSNLIKGLECTLGFIAGDEDFISVPFALKTFDEQGSSSFPFVKLHFILELDNRNIECEYTFDVAVKKVHWEELKCTAAGKKILLPIFSRQWDDESKKWLLKLGKSSFAKQFAKEITYVHEMETKQDNLLLTMLSKRANFQLFNEIASWASSVSIYKEKVNEKNSKNLSRIFTAPVFSEEDELISFTNENDHSDALNSFVRLINPVIKGASLQNLHKDNLAFEGLKNTDDFFKKHYQFVFEYDIPGEMQELVNFIVSNSESKGVWTAIRLFPSIHRALNHGGLLIVDELENSLHPLLMGKIISLFTSPESNPGQGQLVFTTHNALLMDKKHFRQDEIVFVEKDENGASSIYRLSDIEGVRSDLDFCKNYILGAFGAVPNLTTAAEDAAT
jgi:AAA15 family ATPase/GTPase